jgi:hypothetical protein
MTCYELQSFLTTLETAEEQEVENITGMSQLAGSSTLDTLSDKSGQGIE